LRKIYAKVTLVDINRAQKEASPIAKQEESAYKSMTFIINLIQLYKQLKHVKQVKHYYAI
jgi:hypothetical protein